jgi:hypothetical protein
LFDSTGQAEVFLTRWFRWYNYGHWHTGLNLHTPASVHSDEIDDPGRFKQLFLATGI